MDKITKRTKIKFNNLEDVLQTINVKYISLAEDEVKENQVILAEVVNRIINCMKDESKLFRKLFNKVFYGGSYYDDLRIGQPSEFDLDLLMKIHRCAKPKVTISNVPGFVKIEVGRPERLGEQFIKKLLGNDDNYLSAEKTRKWIEGICVKAMRNFKKPNGCYELTVSDCHKFTVQLSKSGPAMTLKLFNESSKSRIDIDFVPCFEFEKEYWPVGGYTPNPVRSKETFFVVPKSPKENQVGCNRVEIARYWRLSFQEQERELIKDKGRLKPTLRLFKKLRDTQKHNKIASYFIKTIFLLEDRKRGPSFWNGSFSEIFLNMLNAYVTYVSNGNIPYFWNNKNNLLLLLSDREKETLNNFKHQLINIRKDIMAKKDREPTVVIKYLVPRHEMDKLGDYDLSTT